MGPRANGTDAAQGHQAMRFHAWWVDLTLWSSAGLGRGGEVAPNKFPPATVTDRAA